MTYIVCGWYTPDYRPWYEKLARSLDRFAQPHDFVEVPKQGGWEKTTLLKAGEVLKALDRYPDKVVIFIDVDCEVRGDLSPLTQLRGDVAFYLHPRRRRSGHTKAQIRSGTMVFKPTPKARRFVEKWVEISADARFGDVDQDALLLATNTQGVTFEQLDVSYCATRFDKCDEPIIFHDSASKTLPKISSTKRRAVSLVNYFLRKASRQRLAA